MIKYIDAENLKSAIKAQINKRNEWLKDPDRTDRQDQLWSDLNNHAMEILSLVSSLQQETSEVDLEEEIKNVCGNYSANDFHDKEHGKDFIANFAYHFYELGRKAGKEDNK